MRRRSVDEPVGDADLPADYVDLDISALRIVIGDCDESSISFLAGKLMRILPDVREAFGG